MRIGIVLTHHLQPAFHAQIESAGLRTQRRWQRRHHAAAGRHRPASPTCTCGRMRGPGTSSAPSRCCARCPMRGTWRSCCRRRWPLSAGMPRRDTAGSVERCAAPTRLRHMAAGPATGRLNDAMNMSHAASTAPPFRSAPLLGARRRWCWPRCSPWRPCASPASARCSVPDARRGQRARVPLRRPARRQHRRARCAAAARVIDTVAPGTNGFLRGTMRGLARERKRQGIGPELPFRLIGRADGRLTLEDPGTGRRVDLESFGPTNAAVFAQLMASAGALTRGSRRHPMSTHRPPSRPQRRHRHGAAGHGADAALLHHRLRGDGPHRRRVDPRRSGTR